MKDTKRLVIILTPKEYAALKEIVENGWGDGDFSGYGGGSASVQKKAMKKLDDAFEAKTGQMIKV
jgi:hypothetical protein